VAVEGSEAQNQGEGRIPEAWIGQWVRVVCPQGAANNVLGVGRRSDTLIDVNVRGVVLATETQRGGQLTRFFPWYSVYQPA
jgi:hypothetical protein